MPHNHKRSKQGKQKQKNRFISWEQEKAERDTFRAVVKDLSYHDPHSREIAFTLEQVKEIRRQGADAVYCVEQTCFASLHAKPRVEKIFAAITPETIETLLADLEAGEVLNRGFEPCWWR